MSGSHTFLVISLFYPFTIDRCFCYLIFGLVFLLTSLALFSNYLVKFNCIIPSISSLCRTTFVSINKQLYCHCNKIECSWNEFKAELFFSLLLIKVIWTVSTIWRTHSTPEICFEMPFTIFIQLTESTLNRYSSKFKT